MRAVTNRPRSHIGMNMTPMIDIVFQLIVFFLVASHLAQQEVQLELDLPSATEGQRLAEDQPRRIVVNVLPEDRPEGRILIGGRLLTTAKAAALIGYESRHAQGDLEVRIRSDRRVPYRDVEPILLACAEAGVWRVSFAVVAAAGSAPAAD